MIGKRLYAKIKAYQGNEKLPGEVKFSIEAKKENLGLLRADWNTTFLKEIELFLEPVVSMLFKNELSNNKTYEIGVYNNEDSPENGAKFVFEGEITKTMALTMGSLGDGKADEETRRPTIVFKVQSNSMKFKDYFPQNLNTGCWLQINDTEEPDLLDGEGE